MMASLRLEIGVLSKLLPEVWQVSNVPQLIWTQLRPLGDTETSYWIPPPTLFLRTKRKHCRA